MPVGAKGLTLKQHIEHTLGTGAVEDAVRLPPGEDLSEWLAVNTGAGAGAVRRGDPPIQLVVSAGVGGALHWWTLMAPAATSCCKLIPSSPVLFPSPPTHPIHTPTHAPPPPAVVFYNAINVLYQVLDETLCTSQVGWVL